MHAQSKEASVRQRPAEKSTQKSDTGSEPVIVESARVAQAFEALSQRTDYIISLISPDIASEEFRMKIFTFLSKIINIVVPDTLIVPYGSFISKAYVPNSDLDICCYNHGIDEIPLLKKVQEALLFFNAMNRGNQSVSAKVTPEIAHLLERQVPKEEQLEVQTVELIFAKISLVKLTICGLGVDISAAQPGSLITSLFIEKLAHSIGKNNLLKRSFLLIQAWCLYEGRILGGHSQMLSSYALRVMIINILVNCVEIHTPFQALYVFLAYYSNFNYCQHIIHPTGFLSRPISSPSLTAQQIGEDMGKLTQYIPISYLNTLRSLKHICDKPTYQSELQNMYEVLKSYPRLHKEAQAKLVERLGDPNEIEDAQHVSIKNSNKIDKGLEAGSNTNKVRTTLTIATIDSSIERVNILKDTHDRKDSSDGKSTQKNNISETAFTESPTQHIDVHKVKLVSTPLASSGGRNKKVSYDPISLKGLTNLSRSILSYCKNMGAFSKPALTDKEILLLFRGYFGTPEFTKTVSESRVFFPSHISIVDPLQVVNNLGRSVSEQNFHRIIRCLQTAYSTLSDLVHMCMTGKCTVTDALVEYDCFFITTLSLFGDVTKEKIQTVLSGHSILTVDLKTLEAGCHLVGATMLGLPITAASSLASCLQTNHQRPMSSKSE